MTTGSRAAPGVFVFAFPMVLREGVETVLFLAELQHGRMVPVHTHARGGTASVRTASGAETPLQA